MQTRVYPFILAQAGGQLNAGVKLAPENIEMAYWFSNFPAAPIKFQYSKEKFDGDKAYITQLVDEISNLDDGDFQKTENVGRCRYCIYRSLCNRGVNAGSLDDLESELEPEFLQEEASDFDLDFDQIAEIEF